MTVVVDASLALKWVVEEDDTEDALALLGVWEERAERVFAPPIFRPEVTNAFHQKVRQGDLSRADAADLLDSLLSRVVTLEPQGLYRRALNLAGELGVGSIYDALYLALAESQGCEMWTADQRFVRLALPRFPQVRWIGES